MSPQLLGVVLVAGVFGLACLLAKLDERRMR